jgi:hypothetical protein
LIYTLSRFCDDYLHRVFLDIRQTLGESEQSEFKKSTGELKGGLETLCALLNGQGGRVMT